MPEPRRAIIESAVFFLRFWVIGGLFLRQVLIDGVFLRLSL